MLDINFFVHDILEDVIVMLAKHPEYLINIKKDNNSIDMFADIPAMVKAGYINEAKMIKKLDKFVMRYCQAMGEVFRLGPKILCPSYEDCLAFEHIKINLDLSDYEQPYPVVLVEVPYKYYQHLKDKFDCEIPKGLICHHLDKNTITFTLMYNSKEGKAITSVFNAIGDIEKSITDPIDQLDNVNNEIITIMQRLTFNLNLVMVTRGFSEHKNIPKRQKKNKLLNQEITLIGLEQKIPIFRKVTFSEDEGGTHKSPHPHWRCGHHRMQHFGKGNEQRKRIFIPPVFVCSENYGGDMGDTNVVYTS